MRLADEGLNIQYFHLGGVVASVIWTLTVKSGADLRSAAFWAVDSHCVTEADALRAADRSRNGISKSCNSEMLDNSGIKR